MIFLIFLGLNISPLTIFIGPIKTLFSRFLGEVLHDMLGLTEVKDFFQMGHYEEFSHRNRCEGKWNLMLA